MQEQQQQQQQQQQHHQQQYPLPGNGNNSTYNVIGTNTNPSINNATNANNANSVLPPHADDPNIEIPRVLKALEVLHSPPPSSAQNHQVQQQHLTTDDPSSLFSNRRDLADRYLVSFQRTRTAWAVCRALLSQAGLDPSCYFFAAQTLHAKIRVDMRQLFPSSSIGVDSGGATITGDNDSDGRGNASTAAVAAGDELRGFLSSHLARFGSLAGVAGASAVMSRLAMALATLAVQMRWYGVVDDVVAAGGGGSNGGGNNGNEALNPRVALEIFRSLPEEAASHRLLLEGGERDRATFRTALSTSAGTVLDFCDRVSANTPGLSTVALRCLHSWVRDVNVPPSVLSHSALVGRAFDVLAGHTISDGCVDDGESFEAAADAAVCILRNYTPGQGKSNECLVAAMVPRCMGLATVPDENRSAFRRALVEFTAEQIGTGDVNVGEGGTGVIDAEDRLRAYCRIFSEMGESYMELILSHEEMNQVALVELVLLCSAVPDVGECS